MKILIKILIGLAALFAISSHAEVVKFEQIQSDFEPKVLEQPYILSSPSARIYISSGTGRSIRLYFKDIEGSIVVAREKFNVDYDDTFQIDGTTHYGAIFEVESLPEGPLTLTVERGTFDAVNDFITNTYEVIVDKTPPSITGSFFWDAHSTAYWTTHTDGKFIVSLAGARQAGFPIGMAGISGYSHSTFTSEFLDGPRAGEKHANELPAQLTNDGRLIIGTGVDNSISTAYVPSNTARRCVSHSDYSTKPVFHQSVQLICMLQPRPRSQNLSLMVYLRVSQKCLMVSQHLPDLLHTCQTWTSVLIQ